MSITIPVFLFFLSWGIISLICQGDHRVKNRIKSLDIFGLIPNYKFFCPNPIRYDYHLYYRDTPSEDAWREIRVAQRSLAVGFLWNPEKRDRKVFMQAVTMIRQHYKNNSNKTPGPVYRFVLNYILLHAQLGKNTPIQFKITTRIDFDTSSKEKVIFISRIHHRKEVENGLYSTT